MHARLGLVRLIVSHPNVTLYTLNAPQEGLCRVTPLAVAAYLDRPEWVRMLLQVSRGLVYVDAPDMYAATPLMCECSVHCNEVNVLCVS